MCEKNLTNSEQFLHIKNKWIKDHQTLLSQKALFFNQTINLHEIFNCSPLEHFLKVAFESKI